MSSPDQVMWEVPVFDALLMRPQALVVEVAETRVVVVPPSGEGFVVPAESIRLLCEALQAAHSVAEHRAPWLPGPPMREQKRDEPERVEQLPDCTACGNTGRRAHERNSAPPISVPCSCGRASR